MNFLWCISVAACLLLLTSASQWDAEECSNITGSERLFTLSINHKRDIHTGQWARTYVAQKTGFMNPMENDIVLEAKHSDVECRGRNVVRLEVVVKDKWSDFLLFHRRHGKNAVVVEDGRTAQKIDAEDRYNAVFFTSRPLRNDEIFEVRLEKRVNKTEYSLGIGVTSLSPDDMEIPLVMHTSDHAWIMKHGHIYQSNKHLKTNYGKSLNTLKVNDRVGVMRRADGELHFFINGDDQGSAAVVPEGVYGVLELWHDANRARIVY